MLSPGVRRMLLCLAATVAACDAAPPDAAPSVAPGPDPAVDVPSSGVSAADTVVILMSDGAISPSAIRLRVGRSTVLRVRNDGSVLHELMIGREPGKGSFLVPFFDGVAADLSGPVMAAETDAGRARHEASGSLPDSMHYQLTASLGPGEEAHIAFVPPPDKAGEWEARCVTLDHFASGERAAVIVEQ